MKKSDTRIQRTNHNTTRNSSENIIKEQPIIMDSVEQYPTPHPCDDGDTPEVPDRPKPNPNRPKPSPSPKEGLIYTNGVQKVDNVVSVKVHPDSTNYMRTSERGLSILFLINKLECIGKSIKKLNDNVNQLKDEVQPDAIIEKIVEQSDNFEINPKGLLELKIGDGLATDADGRLSVDVDEDTLGFDENGKLMTIWGHFEHVPDNG